MLALALLLLLRVIRSFFALSESLVTEARENFVFDLVLQVLKKTFIFDLVLRYILYLILDAFHKTERALMFVFMICFLPDSDMCKFWIADSIYSYSAVYNTGVGCDISFTGRFR